jgi:hypothetical protein
MSYSRDMLAKRDKLAECVNDIMWFTCVDWRDEACVHEIITGLRDGLTEYQFRLLKEMLAYPELDWDSLADLPHTEPEDTTAA